ncbi:Cytochrome c oxidase assembly protein cox15 [Coelomomyces lativittatus]|nr:Cytochrome c oxidase assembly protein cox15 [Coelomomyces lativittatus]
MLRCFRFSQIRSLHFRPTLPVVQPPFTSTSFFLPRKSRFIQPYVRRLHTPTTTPSVTWTYPIVGNWFLLGASLVFGIVVVGGITRLTESGLSITEWNAIRGMQWPMNSEAWHSEFEKYKGSPEFKLMNHDMNLSEFQRIYYWEWLHRNLGRIIGVTFLLPTMYFTWSKPSLKKMKHFESKTGLAPQQLSRWMTPKVTKIAWTCCVLVGFQGALGWYMVKSGLEPDVLEVPNATPRVSQYRLAAHLGSAFVIYLLSVWQGLQILHENKVWLRSPTAMSEPSLSLLQMDQVRRFFKKAHWVSGLVFVTAMSGALVAGLDAGLVYPTWPKMGDRYIPSSEELFPHVVSTTQNGQAIFDASKASNGIQEWFEQRRYRNFFENPVLVQLDHRLLAYSTFASIVGLWGWGRRLGLPPSIQKATHVMLGAALVQVGLGISTLLYFVPIELAASHQAGSLVLLTSATYLLQKTKQVIK